jgi:hypothetical protein
VLPGVVDADHCESALDRIEELLESRPPQPGHHGHYFLFEDGDHEPALMTALTGTPLWRHAQALVNPLVLNPCQQVQVALTFPPHSRRPTRGHVDGLTPPEPGGRPGTFTLLVGLALSDQTHDDMGNLFVWPGTHRLVAEHLRTHGADTILDWDGLPPVDHGEPVQIYAAPGDVILAHYLLSHAVGSNTSPVTRKSLYFRLKVVGHDPRWREIVTDPTLEFPAVRSAQHVGP